MLYKITSATSINNKKLRKKIYKLNKYMLKQNEKVAYLYKNLATEDTITFNPDICFYAASSIKFLVCLYLYEQAESNNELLNKKILLTEQDYKVETSLIKQDKDSREYTIKELIYHTLKESDNAAYIKLVNYVTPEKIKEYGLSLGATHTLEGKDLFGITSANDMVCYLTRLYKYLNHNTELSRELKSFMSDPTYKIIDSRSINNKEFIRKYGEYGIAYHEVGIVYDIKPYILIVLTQKDEYPEKLKRNFINKVAKKINAIHQALIDN